MIRKLAVIVIGVSFSSCLKEIDAMNHLNTNIFDPDYAGDKWYSIDEAYKYTNSFNNELVFIKYSIPESAVPLLQPIGFPLTADCNNYPTVIDSVTIQYEGHYEGDLLFPADGSTEYCIDLGIYIREEDTTINRFSECVSL